MRLNNMTLNNLEITEEKINQNIPRNKMTMKNTSQNL